MKFPQFKYAFEFSILYNSFVLVTALWSLRQGEQLRILTILNVLLVNILITKFGENLNNKKKYLIIAMAFVAVLIPSAYGLYLNT